MDRAARRKQLQDKPQGIRGVKDGVLQRTQKSLEQDVIEFLQSHVLPPYHHTIKDIEILNIDMDQPMQVEANITLSNGEQTPLQIDIPWKNFQTKTYHAEYFEAIAQIRGFDPQPILEFIGDRLTITKAVELKNGIDLYITDQHQAQSIMKQVKKRFGGTLKVSTRLNGVDHLKSKKLYRITIALINE